MTGPPLDAGPTVVFEARRAAELARMLERHGARILAAPALREAPLEDSPAVRACADAIERRKAALLVLTTGVGTRALAAALAREGHDAPALLRSVPIVARGPKPLAALRELEIDGAHPVPSPNTWRETLDVIDGLGIAPGSLVVVQEYGTAPRHLLDGLASRGLRSLAVPVYRWELPVDTTALRQGVAAILDGTAAIAVFTSAAQVEHAFRVASEPAALRRAFTRVVVASIGPVCSEALDVHGVAVDLEADPPKLGPLVALIAKRAPALVAAKRSGR